MTDQQRFDAIQHVQNELPQYKDKLKVRTPNMDRIFQEGVYFESAYCQSPVCAPARGALRTGCTIERTGLQANKSEKKEVYEIINMFKRKVQASKSLDQILAEELGYQVEYYGKWHIPDEHYYRSNGVTPAVRSNDYDYSNGQFKLKTHEDWALKLRRYLQYDLSKGNIKKEFKNGEQKDTYTGFPYTPIQIDARYGLPTDTSLDNTDDYPQLEGRRTQPNLAGPFSLGKGYTPIRYNGEIAVKALERLSKQNNVPFALTVSFHNPHAPMTPALEYLEYYWKNRNDLFVSPSVTDNMKNTAYSNKKYVPMGYTDETKLKEWIACYYAMIEEIDVYVGQLLDVVQKNGVAENTLIIFTSDHGEMLGAHGMREKNVFYEESVRIPLAVSFPGTIPSNSIVVEGVSHLDLFATVLDYLGHGDKDKSDGTSLRRFIEKKSFNENYDERFVVSEWDFRKPIKADKLDRSLGTETNFMILKGKYKLMMTKLAEARRLDMMYDLENDPYEMNNLIGSVGDTASEETIGKAEHLKCLLVEWMSRMNGPGYYSNSIWSDSSIGPFSDGIKTSAGDINEIKTRRKWRTLDFWVSDTELKITAPILNEMQYVQNEYLYFGRTTAGFLKVDSVVIKGNDANLFTIESVPGMVFSGICGKIKISFKSDVFVDKVDARLELTYDGSSTKYINIVMDEQIATFEPTASFPPTPSPTPNLPTSSPTPNPPTSSPTPDSNAEDIINIISIILQTLFNWFVNYFA